MYVTIGYRTKYMQLKYSHHIDVLHKVYIYVCTQAKIEEEEKKAVKETKSEKHRIIIRDAMHAISIDNIVQLTLD